MNILVINGSPKGDNSITLQTVLYIQKHFPAHTFTVLNAGSRIRSFEKDFSEAELRLREAELILFAYPVYTFLVPSQLHRFIELMKEHHVDVRGKYASQITTSKHFYDMTAHRFIEDNCQDLGLRVIHGLSADMDDLLSKKGRKDALSFMFYVEYCVTQELCEPVRQTFSAPRHLPVTATAEKGARDAASADDEDEEMAPSEKPGDVVIVADLSAEDKQLESMIRRFRTVFPRKRGWSISGNSPSAAAASAASTVRQMAAAFTRMALTVSCGRTYRPRRPSYWPFPSGIILWDPVLKCMMTGSSATATGQ